MTKVEICNMALGRIGDAQIVSLADTTKAAKGCASFYENTKAEIIRIFPWNCAIARSSGIKPAAAVPWVTLTSYKTGEIVRSGLTPDLLFLCISEGTSGDTAPAGTGQYADGTVLWLYIGSAEAFNNQTVFEHVYIQTPDSLRILDINGNKKAMYRIEGPFIYTNEDPCVFRYAKRIEEAEMDPVMIEAIVSRLAVKLCYLMTGNAQNVQSLYQEFTLNISIARQIASAEDQEDLIDVLQLYTNAQIALRQNSVQE